MKRLARDDQRPRFTAGFLFMGMLPAFLTAEKQMETGRAITKRATRQGRAQAQSRQGFRSNESV